MPAHPASRLHALGDVPAPYAAASQRGIMAAGRTRAPQRTRAALLAADGWEPPSPILSLALTPVPEPRFGVVDAYLAPRAAADLGVQWERNAFWWSALQPTGPRSWNFFATDRDHEINRELRAGRSIVGELINTPDWAAVDPHAHGASVPKGLYLPYNDPRNYWGHFVGLIARRYAGRIDDWIIWNEISIPRGQFHTWDGTLADYAQLVKVAYLAATAANPHTRIILAGDPYWYSSVPGAWLQEVVQLLTQEPGAAAHHDYFDVANLHLYNSPTQLLQAIPRYQQILNQFGLQKPIWIAETNSVPYDDPIRRYAKASFYGTMDDQASYMIETFALSLVLGVQRIEVNRMTDGTDFLAGGVPLGLLRNDGTARPAFYAYGTAATLFAGVTDGSLSVQTRTGIYMVTLNEPNAVITVAWDQGPLTASASIAATSATGTLYNKFGSSRRLNAVDGRYRLQLPPASDNSDAADPRAYVVGGDPLILVQPTVPAGP